MITIEDGRKRLYQWDLNQRLLIEGYPAGTEVHYASCRQGLLAALQSKDATALIVESYTESGKVYADIPNSLLQTAGDLHVYIYTEKGDEAHTDRHIVLAVMPREKPADYIYTETDVLRWTDLAEEIEKLKNLPEYAISSFGGGAWLEKQGVDTSNISIATYPNDNRCTSVNYLELEVGKAYDFIDYGGATFKLYFADDNMVYQGAETDIRCTDFRTTVTPQFKYCRVMYYSGDVSLAEQLRVSEHYEVNHKLDSLSERMDAFEAIDGGRKKITVGASGDYAKLTDALAHAYAVGDIEIYVESGTYDIVSELGTLSGTGPVIGNNTKIVFNPKAFVTCEYEGGDAEIEKNFAPLNAGVGDFEIYGLQITCKNVRYCVHDERNGDEQYYSHIYERCRMTLDNSASSWDNHQCIGGGMGKWGDITIRDCQFESAGATAEKGIVTWHNTTDYMARGRIVLTGCYFHGDNATFSLGCYGDTTYVTRALVSNNSFGVAPFVEYEDPDTYTNLNMAISAWNNEIRSSATSTGDGITLTDDGEGNVTIS